MSLRRRIAPARQPRTSAYPENYLFPERAAGKPTPADRLFVDRERLGGLPARPPGAPSRCLADRRISKMAGWWAGCRQSRRAGGPARPARRVAGYHRLARRQQLSYQLILASQS